MTNLFYLLRLYPAKPAPNTPLCESFDASYIVKVTKNLSASLRDYVLL